MVYFKDRYEAGKQLVPLLEKYAGDKNTVVIGLPRGGVVTAYEVAMGLELPLDVVCPRKVGAPMNPEFAIGAVTETGEGVIDQLTVAGLQVSMEYLQKKMDEERVQAQRRLHLYRKDLPSRDLVGKSVIIVDDGLATGSTMRAAIQTVKAEKAEKVIIAVPVSPPDTYEEIADMVDEIVCLDVPRGFHAVGQYYQQFGQTEDQEVIDLLQQARN